MARLAAAAACFVLAVAICASSASASDGGYGGIGGAVFEVRTAGGLSCVFKPVDGNPGEWIYDKAVASGGTALTTDLDGWIILRNVPEGDYALHEKKAPDGYNSLTEPIAFHAGPDVRLIVPNHVGAELPDTGGSWSLVCMAVGLAVMGAAVLIPVRTGRASP